jgi:hypothetical protein
MFDPVPVLGKQGNRQVKRFDLVPHTHNVQLLCPQNQVHILHDPPPSERALPLPIQPARQKL